MTIQTVRWWNVWDAMPEGVAKTTPQTTRKECVQAAHAARSAALSQYRLAPSDAAAGKFACARTLAPAARVVGRHAIPRHRRTPLNRSIDSWGPRKEFVQTAFFFRRRGACGAVVEENHA